MARSLEICGFLGLVGFPLDVRVNDGKAGDSVEGGDSEEE